MEVNALAKIEGDTKIRFMTNDTGLTEMTFGKTELIIEATGAGLRKLAKAVKAALRDRGDGQV